MGGNIGKSGDSSLKGGGEFKFFGRSFDDLGFLYDHLHVTEDVEKAKTISSHKLLQHLGIFLIMGYILGHTLFEVSDLCDQQANELRLELSRLKEAQVTDQTLVTSCNEMIFGLEKEIKSIEDECNSLKVVKIFMEFGCK